MKNTWFAEKKHDLSHQVKFIYTAVTTYNVSLGFLTQPRDKEKLKLPKIRII